MRYFMNTFANNYTLIDEVKQCWKQPGNNTKYARFTANDPDDGNANFSRTSNVFNYKGDYLCIREISLQYNVPTNKLTKLGIQNLAITLAGNNLHYFTAVRVSLLKWVLLRPIIRIITIILLSVNIP